MGSARRLAAHARAISPRHSTMASALAPELQRLGACRRYSRLDVDTQRIQDVAFGEPASQPGEPRSRDPPDHARPTRARASRRQHPPAARSRPGASRPGERQRVRSFFSTRSDARPGRRASAVASASASAVPRARADKDRRRVRASAFSKTRVARRSSICASSTQPRSSAIGQAAAIGVRPSCRYRRPR